MMPLVWLPETGAVLMLKKARASLVDLASFRLSYDVALGITKYLSNERQYVPWQSATSAIGYFDDVLYYTEVNVNLQQYQRQLSQDVYNEVGWVDEGDYNMKMLRTRSGVQKWHVLLDFKLLRNSFS